MIKILCTLFLIIFPFATKMKAMDLGGTDTIHILKHGDRMARVLEEYLETHPNYLGTDDYTFNATQQFLKFWLEGEKYNFYLKKRPTKTLKNDLLAFALKTTTATKKIWLLFADFHIKRNPDSVLYFSLFESRTDIASDLKIDLLTKLVRVSKQNEILTTYILGQIRKEEIKARNVMDILQYDFLTEGDWLAIVDNLFPAPTPPKKNDNEIGGYPASSSLIFFYLMTKKRSFWTDIIILHHLSQRFVNNPELRYFMMTYWAEQMQLDPSLSMDQLSILENQVKMIGNLPLATPLTDRAHPMLSSPTLKQYRPLISIVASAGPSGDGVNPETFDYHRGKQFPQLSLIVPELMKRGLRVKVLNWEDPNIDWKSHKFLFALGLWGWSKQWVELDKWLERIKSYGITLINSMDFINWNNRKTYLKDFQDANIPVIPTLIIASDSTESLEEIYINAEKEFQTRDIIFKGVVGAGGAEYHHCDPNHPEEARAKLEELKQNNCGVVVQPFWKEVYENGELSFGICGSGTVTHSYLKLCAPEKELVQVFHGGQSFHISKEDLSTKSKEFFEKLRAFRPDLKLTLEELINAHGNIYKTLFSLKKFFYERGILMPPFFRLDCVVKNGQSYMMELEGIPYMEWLLAMTHDPSKDPVQWSTDDIIRQFSIFTGLMR